MKELYNYRFKYQIEGYKGFIDTSIWRHVRYLLPEEAQSYDFTIKSFAELLDLAKNGLFMNAEIGKTTFTKKPFVRLSNPDCMAIKVTEKNFKPINVRIEYNKMESLTIKSISEMLSVDDFIDYLKDRGITKI